LRIGGGVETLKEMKRDDDTERAGFMTFAIDDAALLNRVRRGMNSPGYEGPKPHAGLFMKEKSGR
jgi:hypothetical protein